ncbi:MAG: hypothetical protein AAB225_26830 [Acidobacteriota bacterium]
MHPSESNLALYAGGEMRLWSRWRVARHLERCHQCRRQVEEFGALRQWIRAEDQLPAGLHWGRLAGEIRANIRVGLAAGECVGPVPEPAAFRWRAAAVAMPVVLLVITGWLLQSWRPPLARPEAARGLVLTATAGGIEVREGRSALTLLYPPAAEASQLVSGDAVRIRYVDAETGYVTISHVYAQ